jgi:hypothetical protein
MWAKQQIKETGLSEGEIHDLIKPKTPETTHSHIFTEAVKKHMGEPEKMSLAQAVKTARDKIYTGYEAAIRKECAIKKQKNEQICELQNSNSQN